MNLSKPTRKPAAEKSRLEHSLQQSRGGKALRRRKGAAGQLAQSVQFWAYKPTTVAASSWLYNACQAAYSSNIITVSY